MTTRLLIEATIPTGGTLYRISDEFITDLTNRWDGYVLSFDAVNQRTATRHGGHFQLSVGSIGLSPELFDSAPLWPPAEVIDLSVYTTTSTEAAKQLLFHGQGYRASNSISLSLIRYDIYPTKYDSNILDDGYAKSDTTSYQIVDTAVYKWTSSPATPAEFYLEALAGGAPTPTIATKPDRVYINLSLADEGTVGGLVVGEWDWGDNDTLGYNTVYARITADADPDAQYIGYIRADFGTVVAPMERAFGQVEFQAPTQLPDVQVAAATYAAYNAAHINGSPAKMFTAVTNNGGGKARFASTGHGFSNGDTVTTEVSPGHTYTDTSVIAVIDVNTYDKVSLTYSATAVGHGYKDGYYRSYDSGVPNTGNVLLLTDDRFVVTPVPGGEFTISGTGYDNVPAVISDLDDVGTLVKQKLSLSTFNNSSAESPSPPIAHWETNQTTTVNWFSSVCAYFKHLYSLGTSIVNLVDMEIDSSTTAVTEFQVFKEVQHEKENRPTSTVDSSWTIRDWQSAQGTVSVGNFSKSASYAITTLAFAEPISVTAYHTDRDEVYERLELISAVLQRDNVTFSVRMDNFPVGSLPGGAFTFTDTYLIRDIAVDGRSVEWEFNFDTDVATVKVKQIA